MDHLLTEKSREMEMETELAEEQEEEKKKNKKNIPHSAHKMKKDLSGTESTGGYAFAEDEQRSMQIL